MHGVAAQRWNTVETNRSGLNSESSTALLCPFREISQYLCMVICMATVEALGLGPSYRTVFIQHYMANPRAGRDIKDYRWRFATAQLPLDANAIKGRVKIRDIIQSQRSIYP